MSIEYHPAIEAELAEVRDFYNLNPVSPPHTPSPFHVQAQLDSAP
jgi:hypothetical protein